MKPLSPSDTRPLRCTLEENKHRIRAESSKIGWLETVSASPGAKFDLVIRDVHGRVKLEKKDCGNETVRYGELLNLPTMLGEELEVEIRNLRGAEHVDVLLN